MASFSTKLVIAGSSILQPNAYGRAELLSCTWSPFIVKHVPCPLQLNGPLTPSSVGGVVSGVGEGVGVGLGIGVCDGVGVGVGDGVGEGVGSVVGDGAKEGVLEGVGRADGLGVTS